MGKSIASLLGRQTILVGKILTAPPVRKLPVEEKKVPRTVEVIRRFVQVRLDSSTILRKNSAGQGVDEVVLLKRSSEALNVYGAVSMGSLQGSTFEFGIAVPAESMFLLQD